MKVFQERIMELRKTNGYSQQYVASVLGIKQPSYIRYEKGSAQPNLDNLVKLADLFDVSVDYLLGHASI